MNIRSVELLNQSLQNTADNLYRNRALAASMQEEAQRNAVEQSFRNAMMQHYANIEQKQAEAAGLQEKRLENEDNAVEKKYGVQQSIQDLADAQRRMTKGLQELSLDSKLTPEQKTQYFRQSMDSQPQYKAAFLQNPMWNALYQGQGDWNAVAQMSRNSGQTERAIAAGLAVGKTRAITPRLAEKRVRRPNRSPMLSPRQTRMFPKTPTRENLRCLSLLRVGTLNAWACSPANSPPTACPDPFPLLPVSSSAQTQRCNRISRP